MCARMSFSVDVPAGVLGAEPARVDFSMNNAPTFPINDAHAFAVFMRFASADGARAIWRSAAVARRSSDLCGLVATSVRGERQEQKPSLAFQQMRYWSNVPFQPWADDAVKYSAIPNPDNPVTAVSERSELPAGRARPPRQRRRHDELVRFRAPASRHRTDDASGPPARARASGSKMPASSGKKSRRHSMSSAAFACWPKSVLPAEECDAHFIDVTTNSTADSKPIGGINRARRLAEEASRNARLETERLRCQRFRQPARGRSGTASPASARAGEGRCRASHRRRGWHAAGGDPSLQARSRSKHPRVRARRRSPLSRPGLGAVPRIAIA